MVMAHSLLQAIKKDMPEADIDVLAPAWSAALIDRMPEVRQLVEAPFAHGKLTLSERWRVAKTLRGNNYQRAYILPNSLKSALVPWLAGIPARIGYTGEQRYGVVNNRRVLDKARWPMIVQRYVALHDEQLADDLQCIPKPRLRTDPEWVDAVLNAFGLEANGARTMVLCPGAEFGAAKQWPAHYYSELARQKASEGWQVWLLGSANDSAVCDQIALADPDIVNLAGRTSLPQAIDLISCADLVVSNDSGLMHTAAALGRSVVAIYGPTPPGVAPPLEEKSKTVWLGLDCSPCFKRQCPLGHLNCMNQLSVAMVTDQIDALLGAQV